MVGNFDYLNEVIMLFGKKNRRNGTYAAAQAMKKRGDAWIFNSLAGEYCSRIKWTYEPADGRKTIDTSLIERTIMYGICGLAKTKQKAGSGVEFESWRNTRVTGTNNLSFYGKPTSCTLVDYAGRTLGKYIPVLDEDESDIANCALIYDNPNMVPPIYNIMHYAERLSIINASINGCIQNITGTTIVWCDEGQERDMVKDREAASVGLPYILKYKTGDMREKPELLSTPGVSEELKTLFESWDKTHSDYLLSIGIRANNSIDKRSGVTPMEIVESRQVVDLTLNNAVDMRRKAIEQFERIGGDGLKCELTNFESKTVTYSSDGKNVETGEKKEEEKREEKEEEKTE